MFEHEPFTNAVTGTGVSAPFSGGGYSCSDDRFSIEMTVPGEGG